MLLALFFKNQGIAHSHAKRYCFRDVANWPSQASRTRPHNRLATLKYAKRVVPPTNRCKLPTLPTRVRTSPLEKRPYGVSDINTRQKRHWLLQTGKDTLCRQFKRRSEISNKLLRGKHFTQACRREFAAIAPTGNARASTATVRSCEDADDGSCSLAAVFSMSAETSHISLSL